MRLRHEEDLARLVQEFEDEHPDLAQRLQSNPTNSTNAANLTNSNAETQNGEGGGSSLSNPHFNPGQNGTLDGTSDASNSTDFKPNNPTGLQEKPKTHYEPSGTVKTPDDPSSALYNLPKPEYLIEL